MTSLYTYRLGEADDWIKGTRWGNIGTAVHKARGTILYVWKDQELILAKDIRDQIINYIKEQSPYMVYSLYGKQTELEEFPNNFIFKIIGPDWNITPLLKCIRTIINEPHSQKNSM